MSARDLSNIFDIPWIPGAKVEIRPMSIKEERMLLAYSDDARSYAKLVEKLVTPIENFDFDMMDKITRDYLLTKIRIITYGEMMTYDIFCPKCGHVNKNYRVDLLALPIYDNSYDDLVYTLSDRSNLGVKSVRLQAIPCSKMVQIESILSKYKEDNKNKDEKSLKSELGVLSLELMMYGLFRDYTLDEIRELSESNKLSLYDLKMIMNMMKDKSYGLNTDIEMECRKEDCKHKFTSHLEILSPGFLIPC